MAEITTNQLRAKWSGKDRWLSDGGSRGAGRLVARLTRTGAHFFFQYFAPQGGKRLFPLGPFDAERRVGLRLVDARARSAELAALYRAGTTDIHAHFAQRQRESECERAQAERARQAQEHGETQAQLDAERRSLRRFLMAYVEYLKGAGKPSAKDVANIFENHVFSDRDISDQDAARVSTDDFVRLTQQGRRRRARTHRRQASQLPPRRVCARHPRENESSGAASDAGVRASDESHRFHRCALSIQPRALQES
jgi:hypothetical protein